LGENSLSSIKIKKLKIIKSSSGDVMRVLKKEELNRWNFKEAYISKIKFNKVKAWKFHLKMKLNLVVPFGEVKFVFYSKKKKRFKVVIIGEKKYSRLTVPPRIWFGFKGLSKKESYILSLTNFSHKSKEVLRCEKNKIKFDWY
tara:strand:- start:81 stop:509 length:429 start_codon:yes stop_codon:yes gene_type:complete